MKRLRRAQAVVSNINLAIACAFLFLIMIMGGADALSANLFNAPLPVVLELSEILLAASVFLSLAAAGAASKHILVDVIVEKLTSSVRVLCERLALLIAAIVLSLMAWRAWGFAVDSLAASETASALIRFPVWPAKLIAAWGVSIAATQCIFDLIALSPSRMR